MRESAESVAALAGGVGAGIGTAIPLALQTDGTVGFLLAAAAGAVVAGGLVVVVGALER